MAKPRQRWTTTAALAAHLGVSVDTVRSWVRRGELAGTPTETRHYTDDRPRRTLRRIYRLYEADVVSLLNHLRGGSGGGRLALKGLWRR